ncbi:large conductance mechanosensitive channel [Entomortierella parvispora]|uniref:Large conductance mechanosensitive channel n=1 Tax=Entomortierella parvispora TaxID=205924 RepID=A0A9P3HKC9_9FUNG|nr:large conductance mechanosensitive channel [Entomortierella parvispora]
MSNYNNYDQSARGQPSGIAPPSSSYRPQNREEDYHPLQNSQQAYDHQDYTDSFEKQQDPTRPKKRNLNPARAVVGGIAHGTQAVVGGVTHGTQAVVGGVTHGAQAVKGGYTRAGNGVAAVGTKLNNVAVVRYGTGFFADYRKFMDRGNVVDLAVAVVVGAAFTAIVTSLVTDIITPVIALASRKNLDENFITLRRNAANPPENYATRLQAKNAGDITWNWGNFVQTVINFIIISGCVFIVVKIYQMGRNTKTEVTEKKCDYCLKGIPINAVRCANCTTWLDWDACARVANLEKSSMKAAESPFADEYHADQSNLSRF